MTGGAAAVPQLDAAHAEFIQGGVSVIVASRDAARVPDAVRGCGCRVSRDRRRVTVLLDRVRAGALLDDLGANGMIAVVFSQPSTHRTIQLKGTDAVLVATRPADRALAAAHREDWIGELMRIGYSREFAEAFWGPLPAALAAVAFTPTAAFQQTPGPAAGQPLER
jgi:hypothetical protein